MDIATFSASAPVFGSLLPCESCEAGGVGDGFDGSSLDWQGLAARFAAVHATRDVLRDKLGARLRHMGSFDAGAASLLAAYGQDGQGANPAFCIAASSVNLVGSVDGKPPNATFHRSPAPIHPAVEG